MGRATSALRSCLDHEPREGMFLETQRRLVVARELVEDGDKKQRSMDKDLGILKDQCSWVLAEAMSHDRVINTTEPWALAAPASRDCAAALAPEVAHMGIVRFAFWDEESPTVQAGLELRM